MDMGPDFLCIGMQKAGTGWLFDQVHNHPDFWMPIKEFRYLHRDIPNLTNSVKSLEKARRARPKRKLDENGLKFLEEFVGLAGKPVDLDSYAHLFRLKGDRICGDITPGYSGMGGEMIEKVAQRFPQIRVCIMVRDPVSRAWSQLSMANRRERFDESMLSDPARFREYLDEYEDVQRVGFPARIVARWRQHAPNLNFRHFFFDDLVSDPDGTRADILSFLGGDAAKPSGELSADHNRKAKFNKLEMTDGTKAMLVDFFRDEIRASVSILGGRATEWAARYGV